MAANKDVPKFNETPDKIFRVPGKSADLRLLKGVHDPASELYQTSAPPRIFGCAISEDKHVREAQNKVIDQYWGAQRFDRLIQFSTLPLVVKKLSIEHSYRYVGGRFLPNGTSSIRFINRYLWHQRKTLGPAKSRKRAAQIEAETSQSDAEAKKFLSLSVRDKTARDLPFVIDCKNFTNYYHFMTEALCHLSLVDAWGLTGPIHFVSPTNPNQRRPFCDGLVGDFFPHLADRVQFNRAPMVFDRAITYYSFREGLGATPLAADLRDHFHQKDRKDWHYNARETGAIIRRNSFDISQKRMAAAAVKRAKTLPSDPSEKRLWVSRKVDENARDRTMENEDHLIKLLQKIGFKVIYFEDYPPLKQAALMQNADVVASYHGAGLANMFYASPSTTVIELGNLHSATYRWEEFKQHASVSGCRYVSFFADLKDVPHYEAVEAVRTNKAMGNISVSVPRDTCAKIVEYIKFICTTRGDTSLTFDFDEVATMITDMRDWDLLGELFDRHAPTQGLSWRHYAMLATKERKQGNLEGALDLLEKAVDCNPGRSVLLNRAIGTAKAAGLSDRQKALTALYAERFPMRFKKQMDARG